MNTPTTHRCSNRGFKNKEKGGKISLNEKRREIMLETYQKIREEKGFCLNNSYSHIQMVLPYDCLVSENCLRQLSNRVERRLKRE